jgi:putative oxidoreductase
LESIVTKNQSSFDLPFSFNFGLVAITEIEMWDIRKRKGTDLMPNFKWLDQYSDSLRGLTRIVIGFLFFQHGLQKLFGVLGGNQVELISLMGFAGVLEFFGGILFAIGSSTRLVAFILAGQMAFAYFIVHAPQGFWPIMNKGELAALYSFIFLYYSSTGGGKWSFDRFILSKSKL